MQSHDRSSAPQLSVKNAHSVPEPGCSYASGVLTSLHIFFFLLALPSPIYCTDSLLTSWAPTLLRYFLTRASTSIRELSCLHSRNSLEHLLHRRDQFARHSWMERWAPLRMEVVQSEGEGQYVQMPSLQSGWHLWFPAGLL